MRAYQFVFNGKNYFSPSMKEYEGFKKVWGSGNYIGEPSTFRCWWKIKHIERGPGWAPIHIYDLLEGKVEYEKVKV